MNGTAQTHMPISMYSGLIFPAMPSGLNLPRIHGRRHISRNSPAPTQSMALNLPDSIRLQRRMIPASTSSDTYGDTVSVSMKSSAAAPMQNIHQPENPSRYITNMKPT